MRGRIICIRTKRNDSKRINKRMASVVVVLDMFHDHGATHARDLKNIFSVIKQIRVFPDKLLVALEMNSINLYTVEYSYRLPDGWQKKSKYIK